MKFNILMILKAVVCLCLGVPILLFPEFTYSLFGIQLDPAGTFPAREYGAALIGTMLITWFARNEVKSNALRAIILGMVVYNAIGFVITLSAQLSGQLSSLGWLAVAIYLFFTVGFGYFLVKSPQKPVQESAA